MAFATFIRMISTAFVAEEIGAYLPASAHKTTARFHATLSIVSTPRPFVKNLPAALARFSREIPRVFSVLSFAAVLCALAVCVFLSACAGRAASALLRALHRSRALFVRREVIRRNKAVSAAADEVFAIGRAQRFSDQGPVSADVTLHQHALHRLVFPRFCNIDRLHRGRIQPRIIHARGCGTGRGVKILHLLRPVILLFEVERKLDRVVNIAAGCD
jgi:hypothetical protein